jgi:outer membrane receptor for ferrienterochelin and colicins
VIRLPLRQWFLTGSQRFGVSSGTSIANESDSYFAATSNNTVNSPVPLRLALAAALCLATAAAHAQSAQTIVVTGSATEKSLADAPASIGLITREQIEARPVQELAELLGSVPGVTLTRNGNGVPGVQIRGLASNYTLVLIDGRRVNSTSAVFRGNDYDLGWVPAEEIERIEVVRGPMSSLYGSDAIGGVVNIITRKVGQRWRGSLRADLVTQENDLAGDSWMTSFSLSGPLVKDLLGLKLFGGADHRDADDPALNPQPASGARQPAMPLLDNRYLGAQLAFTPHADHALTLDLDNSRRDHGGFELDRDTASLRYKGRAGMLRPEARVYQDITRNQTGTVTGQVNPNKATTRVVDGKITLPLPGLDQSLTVGGEWRDESLTDKANLSGQPGSAPRSDPSTSVTQKALFAEADIHVGERFTLTLGDRFDHHQNFGGHHSPRVYGVLKLGSAWMLKAGWARAFKAPTLLQNSPDWGSVSCGSATVGCYIVGSTDLQPETATSSELGLHFDGGSFGASATVFDTRLNNMLDVSSRTANRTLAPTYPNFVGFLADGRPIFKYQNIARVRSQGVELGLRARLSPTLALRTNFTYTDARNTSGSVELPLTYRSKHVANVSLDWKPAAAWALSAAARYNGEQYISVPANGQNLVSAPAYTMVDLSAAWTVLPQLTLRAGVLNATDERIDRTLSTEFNEDGRRWFVSVGTRF